MKKHEFEKNVEKMIDPIEVGTIHFMQTYSSFVPNSLMDKVLTAGAKSNPYMGFVVEPYSMFVCYEIIDLELARKLIPDGYELVKTKVFESDEPKYYCIFGCFNVHTSAFWGTRMEFNIIAKNIETGLTSWVIVDYETNTVSFDKKNGLIAGNTKECIFTTNYNGNIILDIKSLNNNREFVMDTSVTNGEYKKLDKKLWVEGNLSVAYGRDLANNDGSSFSTIFKTDEVVKAIEIVQDEINVERNDWYPGLFDHSSIKIACFPFAQHYLSDSPGHYSKISSGDELVNIVENFDFNNIPRYSSKGIKSSFKIGQVVSLVVISLLVIWILILL